jgi:hypothetical protein
MLILRSQPTWRTRSISYICKFNFFPPIFFLVFWKREIFQSKKNLAKKRLAKKVIRFWDYKIIELRLHVFKIVRQEHNIICIVKILKVFGALGITCIFFEMSTLEPNISGSVQILFSIYILIRKVFEPAFQQYI